MPDERLAHLAKSIFGSDVDAVHGCDGDLASLTTRRARDRSAQASLPQRRSMSTSIKRPISAWIQFSAVFRVLRQLTEESCASTIKGLGCDRAQGRIEALMHAVIDQLDERIDVSTGDVQGGEIRMTLPYIPPLPLRSSTSSRACNSPHAAHIADDLVLAL